MHNGVQDEEMVRVGNGEAFPILFIQKPNHRGEQI
jgi:hypothetical protein